MNTRWPFDDQHFEKAKIKKPHNFELWLLNGKFKESLQTAGLHYLLECFGHFGAHHTAKLGVALHHCMILVIKMVKMVNIDTLAQGLQLHTELIK